MTGATTQTVGESTGSSTEPLFVFFTLENGRRAVRLCFGESSAFEQAANLPKGSSRVEILDMPRLADRVKQSSTSQLYLEWE